MNYFTAVFASLALMSGLVNAAEPATDAQQHRWAIGAGVWEATENMDISYAQVAYEFAEYEPLWGIRPTVIGMVSEDGEYYVAGGWLKEFEITERWDWGFGNVVGYFSDTDHLGHHLEFYSRIFVNYDTSDKGFLRLEFGHLSNASISDENPGTETLTLTYNWRI
ncbi:acyloxyacyl hydrolase [Neiella marina]|uniref:Acyloxyacyl hydrolase n=1 Tax=Neiella holothuriorum TaxID=2870530 RepID=A0ABS7EJY8_9GAMM|nr:acyloxyacyl hydrolase [Neiella holothuriorum]MBW8192646.1 acyloxyacyl hydrolase [Neiella holothuriorum]